jgi:hypothetical protein
LRGGGATRVHEPFPIWVVVSHDPNNHDEMRAPRDINATTATTRDGASRPRR